MKKIISQIILISGSWFSALLPLAASEQTIPYLLVVEDIVSALEAGTPLAPAQRGFLFPDSPSNELPYFWELNRKDRRVQRLRVLIAQSQIVSEDEKAQFLAQTSAEAEDSAYEELFIGNAVLPVLLPEEDWAEEFKEYGPSWEEQKKTMNALEEPLRVYAVALEDRSGVAECEEKRIVYVKALITLLRLNPPENLRERRAGCAYFYKEIYPHILEIQQKEIEIVKKDHDFISLICRTNEKAGARLDEISYLMKYVAIEKIREGLKDEESDAR